MRRPSLSCAFWASASHVMMFGTDIHLEAISRRLDSCFSNGNGNAAITTVTNSFGGCLETDVGSCFYRFCPF
jgi:hypothetical protein